MKRVLIVEDDKSLALALREGFEYEGYSVLVAADGTAGLRLAVEKLLTLIILDVMLPKRSGFELCTQLRKAGNTVPIIILSARSEESDKVLGLKLGADDYLTKPFSFMELMARVEAVMRRSSKEEEKRRNYQGGGLEVNLDTGEVFKSGHPLELSTREFAILKYLIEHHGRVVSRNQLLDAVWGYENFSFSRTVDVHVAKLRRKIEDDPGSPRHLVTVHGTGYKFNP
ncbi:MAG: response regulator transcription factor [Acidobacteria bacterium]|nr:response regulator transcription factor [Acidobacteriota bacterium]